jgi:hypothetical protein
MNQPRTPTESLDLAFEERLEQSYEAHREWVRHLVTLCSTGLTLLVGLQNTYVPHKPCYPWLLMVCWGSLALATFCGVVALASKAQSMIELAGKIHEARVNLGDVEAYRKFVSGPPHKVRWYFPAAARALFVLFFVALASLTLFACLNLPQ